MIKFLKEVIEEKRKVKWSTVQKSTAVFFATIVTILVFVSVISLFSWVMVLILP